MRSPPTLSLPQNLERALVSSSSTFTIPSERVIESHLSPGGHFHTKVMRCLSYFWGIKF